MRFTLAAALAGAAFLAASPALAQDMGTDTGERAPFDGLYIGAAGGYDAQSNDSGSTILFDRGLDGRFGDTVTTAAGANAFGTPVGGFCNGRATAGTSPTEKCSPSFFSTPPPPVTPNCIRSPRWTKALAVLVVKNCRSIRA